MGEAELGLGRTDAAIDQYSRALNSGFRTYSLYAHLAAVYALAGKMDEARTTLAEARQLNPKLTVKWMIEHTSGIPAVSESLRKTGLPEE